MSSGLSSAHRKARNNLLQSERRIKMNWEAIGAVGKIFGAIAVIATLIYLAKQIRQQISRALWSKSN
jgi:flagellar biogenesis protein FliO